MVMAAVGGRALKECVANFYTFHFTFFFLFLFEREKARLIFLIYLLLFACLPSFFHSFSQFVFCGIVVQSNKNLFFFVFIANWKRANRKRVREKKNDCVYKTHSKWNVRFTKYLQLYSAGSDQNVRFHCCKWCGAGIEMKLFA